MTYAYTDLDLTLSKQKDGDVQTLTDLDAVKTNILNIVRTIQGSRRMNPEFATGPHDYLFEPLSENVAKNIGEAILYVIETYEDRIDVENIHVVLNYPAAAYNISITFKLKSFGPTSESETFNFILKRL
jgi:phage baseplate assembly protein W